MIRKPTLKIVANIWRRDRHPGIYGARKSYTINRLPSNMKSIMKMGS